MRVIPNRPLRVDATGVTSALPPISPGNYYAIVRANIQANIRELVSDNNTAVSTGTIQTDVPALTLGVGAPFALTAAQSGFYKVTVPAGVDLTLESRRERAGRHQRDVRGVRPRAAAHRLRFHGPGGFTANPGVLVPQTQAGIVLRDGGGALARLGRQQRERDADRADAAVLGHHAFARVTAARVGA